jgi:hypothetical protein
MPIGCACWYLFMRFSLVNIVLCESFNLWIKYPKLPFTLCMTLLGVLIHSPLWGECLEFMMPQLSWLRWHGHKL